MGVERHLNVAAALLDWQASQLAHDSGDALVLGELSGSETMDDSDGDVNDSDVDSDGDDPDVHEMLSSYALEPARAARLALAIPEIGMSGLHAGAMPLNSSLALSEET